MIIYGRAYDDRYLDTILIPSNNYYQLVLVCIHAPIFPEYLEADFLNYEGFQSFISQNGTDGFIYLDIESDYKFPLYGELSKIYSRERDQWILSKSFFQQFYERNKERIQEDQKAVKLFHDWFFKGNFPIIKDSINRKKISANTVLLDLQSIHYNGERIKSLDVKDKNFIKDLVWLDRIIEKHIFKMSHYFHMNSSGAFGLIHFCKSFPARCFLEMIDLSEDKKTFKKCAYCNKFFISHHEKEIYCDRPIDDLLIKDYEKSISNKSIGIGNIFTISDRLPDHYKSCKTEGPQYKYWKNKSKLEIELIGERKKFQNRLLYLKRVGKEEEYQKTMKEFNRWKKQVSAKKGGSSHGKKRK